MPVWEFSNIQLEQMLPPITALKSTCLQNIALNIDELPKLLLGLTSGIGNSTGPMRQQFHFQYNVRHETGILTRS